MNWPTFPFALACFVLHISPTATRHVLEDCRKNAMFQTSSTSTPARYTVYSLSFLSKIWKCPVFCSASGPEGLGQGAVGPSTRARRPYNCTGGQPLPGSKVPNRVRTLPVPSRGAWAGADRAGHAPGLWGTWESHPCLNEQSPFCKQTTQLPVWKTRQLSSHQISLCPYSLPMTCDFYH